jgi:GT2 family glycosyltransferase
VQDFSAVTAACLVMTRKVFDEVGGFDPVHFSVAFNDVDLCLRVRAKGYRVLWTPFAELYHLESASRKSDEEGANVARFRAEARSLHEKWKGVLFHDPFFNRNLTLCREDFSVGFPPRDARA